MTLNELSLVFDSIHERETEDFEKLLFAARQICFYSVKPHVSKKSPIKKPSDLFKLKVDDELLKDKIERVKKGIEHFKKLKDGLSS